MKEKKENVSSELHATDCITVAWNKSSEASGRWIFLPNNQEYILNILGKDKLSDVSSRWIFLPDNVKVLRI